MSTSLLNNIHSLSKRISTEVRKYNQSLQHQLDIVEYEYRPVKNIEYKFNKNRLIEMDAQKQPDVLTEFKKEIKRNVII